jgi:iron complex outermembrane receptor protein
MLAYFARPNQLRSDSLKASFSADTGLGMIDGQVYKNIVTTSYDMVDAVPGVVSDLAVGDKLSTRESVTSAKLQDLFKIGADHTIRVAGEYRYNTMNSVPIEDVQAGYTVYSGSAMWDWTATPQIDLNNAVRFDHLEPERSGPSVNGPIPITNNIPFPTLNALTNAGLANALLTTNPVTWPYTNADFNNHAIDEVSVNSGLVFKATNLDTIRLSYGRGIQVPPLVDYAWYEPLIRPVPLGGGATASVPVLLNGNPTLTPTIVSNYELGYTRDAQPLSSKLSASVFYDTYKSLSSADPFAYRAVTGNQTLLEGQNIGDSSSVGFELGVDGHSDSWRWGASYRFESIYDNLNFTQYDQNGNLTFDMFYKGAAPHNLLTMHGGYTYRDWDFDLFGRYSSPFSLPNPNPQAEGYGLFGGTFSKYTVPAYVTLDARIAYNVTDWAWVAINLVNFQSNSTQFTNAPPVERQGYLTVGVKF